MEWKNSHKHWLKTKSDFQRMPKSRLPVAQSSFWVVFWAMKNVLASDYTTTDWCCRLVGRYLALGTSSGSGCLHHHRTLFTYVIPVIYLFIYARTYMCYILQICNADEAIVLHTSTHKHTRSSFEFKLFPYFHITSTACIHVYRKINYFYSVPNENNIYRPVLTVAFGARCTCCGRCCHSWGLQKSQTHFWLFVERLCCLNIWVALTVVGLHLNLHL